MSLRNWYRRAIPLVLAASVLVPSIAAGQGIESPRIPLRTALNDISTLRTAYVDAFNGKDSKALLALYADDAIAVNNEGIMKGKAAIAKGMGDAANWPHAVLKSDSVRVYGSTAVDVGTWTTHPAEGGEVVAHYLVVLRHDISGWKLSYVADVPMK
jgi:ketosteroid isomerase-like protein